MRNSVVYDIIDDLKDTLEKCSDRLHEAFEREKKGTATKNDITLLYSLSDVYKAVGHLYLLCKSTDEVNSGG